MTRFYKSIRLKIHRVYSTRDLMAVYDVSQNTVSNWVSAGLVPDVRKRPYLFRGDTVQKFHEARRARHRLNLRPGEFKCTGCKLAVLPVPGSVSEKPSRSGAKLLKATCSECGSDVFRFASTALNCSAELIVDPNSTEDRAHEEEKPVPGDVWTSEPRSPASNERWIYKWQQHAGRYSEKTIDRHLASIRWFENFLAPTPFEKLTVEHCYSVRDHLKASLPPSAKERRSKSSVQHLVSQIREYCLFLLKQKELSHLPPGLPDALQLPKAAYATALPKAAKAYPSLDEASELLRCMPAQGFAERRARAIFALAFLGALRADTLISLRLRDIDCADRKITQDGSSARTKNGKSLIIAWFPMPDAFGAAVSNWVDQMNEAGFRPDDALFPSVIAFRSHCRADCPSDAPVAPMTSCHAVTDAFRKACAGHETLYTPHAAKHTIAAERDRRHLTMEHRKAWSANMGHENEQITAAHYGQLPDARRLDIMLNLPSKDTVSADLDVSVEEKAALYDQIVETLRSRR